MIRKFYEADHGYDNSGSSLPSGGKSAEEIKQIAEQRLSNAEWLDDKQKADTTFGFRIGYKAAMEEYASQYASQQPVHGYSMEQMNEYGKLILKSISDTFLNPENLKKASLNDQVVIQAVGETILNFPLPEIQQPVNDGWEEGYEGAHNFDEDELPEPPKQTP